MCHFIKLYGNKVFGIFKIKHIPVVVKLLIKLVFTKLQQVEAILF